MIVRQILPPVLGCASYHVRGQSKRRNLTGIPESAPLPWDGTERSGLIRRERSVLAG